MHLLNLSMENTWKRRLGACLGNTFLFIFRTNVLSEIPRYALKMDAHQMCAKMDPR
jgi:hypothetical protein